MEIYLTKKGNAVGFTAAGETVCGEYMPKRKAWFVSVAEAVTGLGLRSLSESRNRNFVTKGEAVEYAKTLIDPAKTEELKWW